jgi:predicted MFS family arabinose efflux permease
MAYLSEEIHAKAIGLAMGLYISGNALSGMSGRLVTRAVADLSSWWVAIAANGVLALLAAVAFWYSLPQSSNFPPHALRWREIPSSFLCHFGDPGLRWLFAEAFLVMGGFVTPILWGLAVGGEVRFGDAASGVQSGHGSVGLPQTRLRYQRSCPQLIRLEISP